MFEIKKIRIWTLSPTHIGAGTEFQPTSFWIDSNRNKLIEFESQSLIDKLDAASTKEFNAICQTADVFSLQRLMKLIDRTKPSGFREIDISSNIVQKYKKLLDNRNENELSKFEIKKTITSPNVHRPYISGSSLKGAVRTAFISSLTAKTNQNPARVSKLAFNFGDEKGNKEVFNDEKSLLGAFQSDIFSSLKTSDFIAANDVKTTIGYVTRVKRQPDKKGEYKEMSVTMLESINAGSVFEGSLSLLKDMDTKRKFENITDILKKLNEYSLSILIDASINVDAYFQKKVREIQKQFEGRLFLCRLGGYIGAESHTIEGYRKIMIRNPKNRADSKIKEYATMSLYSSPTSKKDLYDNTTFGWCLMEILDKDTDSRSKVLSDFISSNFIVKEKKSASIQPNQTVSATLKAGEIYEAEVISISGGFEIKELKSGLTGFLLGAAGLKRGDKIKVKFLNTRNEVNNFMIVKQ
jgi:CRISPR-associated protein Csm5